MLDVSDGLATDLRHILKQSGVGALVEAEQVPMTGTLDQALYDGEDFELLFTVAFDNVEALRFQWLGRFETELSIIGAITAEADTLQLRQGGHIKILEAKAFEHFSNKTRRTQ